MPLRTQVKRGKKDISGQYDWDYHTLGCFLTAALIDQHPDWEYQEGKRIGDLVPENGQFVDFSMAPIYYMDMPIDLWQKGRQMLLRTYRFDIYKPEAEKDPIEFKAGDTLAMWRD